MTPINFPENFLASLVEEPGFGQESFINAHQFIEPPTTIRVNPYKKTPLQVNQQLPWCPDGFYLNSRPSFTFDPLFHAGCYYVQEASSMFIDHVLKFIRPDTTEPIKVLDLCAAPGGKSTLISSAITQHDLLVANEVIKTRVPALCDNLNRWGITNIIVSNNDPKDFSALNGFFDIMLVDAPCSGSGMFRKDPAAMKEWSEDNVAVCHQRQERILADIYPALKEDGYLIYSTCSYSRQENEDILDWLCKAHNLESIRIPIYKDWGIVETESAVYKAWGYRFYPGKVNGEGLFVACLKKKGKTSALNQFKTKGNQKLPAKEMDLIKACIKDAHDFYLFKVNDDWLAINNYHKESLETLQRHLYIKKSGIRIGKIMVNDLVPDHELALSLIVNRDVFLNTDLDYEHAIQYLRRENMNMNFEDRGWSLMTYNSQALGWAKLLANRVNNYYPKALRILNAPPKEVI